MNIRFLIGANEAEEVGIGAESHGDASGSGCICAVEGDFLSVLLLHDSHWIWDGHRSR